MLGRVCYLTEVSENIITKVFKRKRMSWKGQINEKNSLGGLKAATSEALENVRNIGIIAHVDAGKTTLTERILFFSGSISVMGDVDDGSATMDYLEEERRRGITINSAAISFNWNSRRINLIDTPGHVDFTMEVERALRVVDGVILLLDGSAGVEPQTLEVWRQAEEYKLPVIGFVNKMDKSNVSLEATLRSMEQRLHVRTLLTQIPVFHERKFCGVTDLVSKNRYVWNDEAESISFLTFEIGKEDYCYADVEKGRENMFECLADLDDTFADLYLSENYKAVSGLEIDSAIRRLTLNRSVLPVLCGSAFKSVAVQPLLDKVVSWLPQPICTEANSDLKVLAFKVVYDKQRGFLTFVRVYSGFLHTNQHVYNATSGKKEYIEGIFTAYANRLFAEKKVGPGDIAVVTGMLFTSTGDTLVQNKSSSADILPGVHVPESVFFSSVEAASEGLLKELDSVLQIMQREDPSLRVYFNKETRCTELCGMGELHLLVVKQRLLDEHRLRVAIGPPQIMYKEELLRMGHYTHTAKRCISGSTQQVTLTLRLSVAKSKSSNGTTANSVTNERLKCEFNEDNMNVLQNMSSAVFTALADGVQSALRHGPVLGYPVVNVSPRLLWFQSSSKTALHFVSAAASQCCSIMLRDLGCRLSEPLMYTEVSLDNDDVSHVIKDLSSRGAKIDSIANSSTDSQPKKPNSRKIISCVVPLSEMLNYSSTLRQLTSGSGSFTMTFSTYCQMPSHRQKLLVNSG